MTMQLARDETNMPCEQSLLGLWDEGLACQLSSYLHPV